MSFMLSSMILSIVSYGTLSLRLKFLSIDEWSGFLSYMQKLRKMVVNRLDMLCFQPMHSRDCSQACSVWVLLFEAFVTILLKYILNQFMCVVSIIKIQYFYNLLTAKLEH
jgi:hypothetical protein